MYAQSGRVAAPRDVALPPPPRSRGLAPPRPPPPLACARTGNGSLCFLPSWSLTSHRFTTAESCVWSRALCPPRARRRCATLSRAPPRTSARRLSRAHRAHGRYCRVEGCQTSADELPTQPHTRGRPARLQTELELRPVAPLSPGAPRSPSRTAVRAERAEKRQATSSPSPCHQQGCSPRAGGGCGCVGGSRGSPVVKVNIPDPNRNATSLQHLPSGQSSVDVLK